MINSACLKWNYNRSNHNLVPVYLLALVFECSLTIQFAGMADSEDLGLGPEDQIDNLDDANGITDESILNDTEVDGGAGDDPEMEAIKARVREMEEEAEKLKQLQSEVDKQMNMGSPPGMSMYSSFKQILVIYSKS